MAQTCIRQERDYEHHRLEENGRRLDIHIFPSMREVHTEITRTGTERHAPEGTTTRLYREGYGLMHERARTLGVPLTWHVITEISSMFAWLTHPDRGLSVVGSWDRRGRDSNGEHFYKDISADSKGRPGIGYQR